MSISGITYNPLLWHSEPLEDNFDRSCDDKRYELGKYLLFLTASGDLELILFSQLGGGVNDGTIDTIHSTWKRESCYLAWFIQYDQEVPLFTSSLLAEIQLRWGSSLNTGAKKFLKRRKEELDTYEAERLLL